MAGTQERWQILTDTPGDCDYSLRFLTDSVAKKVRARWSDTERLVLEVKRGPHWVETGHGLAVPDDREGITPEGGAEILVRKGQVLSDESGRGTRLRVNCFGSSQTGSTAKSLWTLILDYSVDDDAEPDAAKQKGDIEIATHEHLRQAAADAYANTNSVFSMLMKALEQNLKLAEVASSGHQATVEAMRLEVEDRRAAREHESDMQSDAASSRRFDVLFSKAADIAEGYFSAKAGVTHTPGASFSKRLAGILDTFTSDEKRRCEDILGDDRWRVIVDASGSSVGDDAFRELMSRAWLEVAPDEAKALFAQLLQIAGQERGILLMKLLRDCGLADM